MERLTAEQLEEANKILNGVMGNLQPMPYIPPTDKVGLVVPTQHITNNLLNPPNHNANNRQNLDAKIEERNPGGPRATKGYLPECSVLTPRYSRRSR